MRKMAHSRLALCILISISILILPKLSVLSVHASMQSQVKVVLNLYDQVCQGDWYGGYAGAPFPEWPKQLPCPGMGGDNDGFVRQLSESDTLENGNNGSRAIETYPTMREAGYIRGTFSLSSLASLLSSSSRTIAGSISCLGPSVVV